MPLVNPIACENSRSGNPANDWEVGAGSDSIQGFTTNISGNLGDPIHFKVDTMPTDGVYHYGDNGFPTDTYQWTNYWVNVVFATTPA
jgi:hypothetical protein